MIKGQTIIKKIKENNYRRLCWIFISLIYAIPVIFGFCYIWQYAVNVPYWDQWDSIVPLTIDWYEGNFDWNAIFQPQNDSRPIISNIITILLSVITALNVKIIFFCGYLLFLTSIFLIFYFIREDINLNYYSLLFLSPIVYYSLNFYYMHRFLENLGALYYPIFILTAFITIYLLSKSKKSNIYYFCSIGTGILCTFSYSAGLTIWFVGLFQLLLQKINQKWEKIGIWIISTIIIFYLYFLGFKTEGLHSTSAYSSFIETTIQYPINKFLCFMGSLGAEIIHDKNIALFFGLIIVTITIALLYINRDSLQLDRYSKWYGLLVLGVITSLEVTLTRSGAIEYIGSPDTIYFIPATRHSLAIFLPIICIYILSIIYLKNSVEVNETSCTKTNDFKSFFRLKKIQNLFLVSIIFTLLLCSVVLHSAPGITLGENNYNKQIVNQYYLQNYANVPDEKMTNLHPIPSTIKSYAIKLEKYNLSVFANTDPEPHFIRFYWLEPDQKSTIEGKTLATSNYKKDPNKKIGSGSIPSIFEHPQDLGTVLTYNNIKIKNGSILDFSIGIDESIWNNPANDGVKFKINLIDLKRDLNYTIFSQTLDPVHNENDRDWQKIKSSLEKYEGMYNIQFITQPNGNTSYDWSWWGEPKILR